VTARKRLPREEMERAHAALYRRRRRPGAAQHREVYRLFFDDGQSVVLSAPRAKVESIAHDPAFRVRAVLRVK